MMSFSINVPLDGLAFFCMIVLSLVGIYKLIVRFA